MYASRSKRGAPGGVSELSRAQEGDEESHHGRQYGLQPLGLRSRRLLVLMTCLEMERGRGCAVAVVACGTIEVGG